MFVYKGHTVAKFVTQDKFEFDRLLATFRNCGIVYSIAIYANDSLECINKTQYNTVYVHLDQGDYACHDFDSAIEAEDTLNTIIDSYKRSC